MKTHLQYLRVAATFAVIVIHVTAFVVSEESYHSNPHGWWFAVIANKLSLWAVPVFVMISGALLLGKVIGVTEFYGARAKRLLPAFFAWNAIYLFAFYIFSPGISFTARLENFALTLSAAPHLWYLPMLLSLMLAAPYLNMLVTERSPSPSEYIILLVLFACIFGCKQLAGAVQIWLQKPMYWPWVWLEYIPYLLGGYILERLIIRRHWVVVIVCVAIIIVSVAVVEHWYRMTNAWIDQLQWFTYSGLPLGIVAVAVFLIASVAAHKLRPHAIIQTLADCSFGVYLVHFLVLLIVWKSWVHMLPVHWSVLVGTILTAILSFALIWLVRKVALGRLIC